MSRVVYLQHVEVEKVQAHGGVGLIDFRRLLDGRNSAGAWSFVDYAVLPPGASIGEHRHADDEELYLILEGVGRMRLDGEEFEVRPGAMIVNRSKGIHGLINIGSAPLRVFVVQVPTRGARSLDG